MINAAHLITDFISYAFGVALFINALMFIPQMLSILKERSSRDVSAVTFCGFLIINLLGTAYGCIKIDYDLIIGYSISSFLNLILVILIFKFKSGKPHSEAVDKTGS